MNEDKIDPNDMVNDISSEEEEAPLPTVTKPLSSPSKQDRGADSPQKPVFSKISDLKPVPPKTVLVRPASIPVVTNGTVTVRAVLAGPSVNHTRLVRPSNQQIVKSAPLRWTQARPRAPGTPSSKALFMAAAIGQQSQTMAPSSTGTTPMSVVISGNRQLPKTYIVNPSSSGPNKSINLVPNVLTDRQGKVHSVVQQKECRLLNVVNPISGGKIATSSPPGRSISAPNQRLQVLGDRRVILKPATQMVKTSALLEGQSTAPTMVLTSGSLVITNPTTASLPVSFVSSGPNVSSQSFTSSPSSNGLTKTTPVVTKSVTGATFYLPPVTSSNEAASVDGDGSVAKASSDINKPATAAVTSANLAVEKQGLNDAISVVGRPTVDNAAATADNTLDTDAPKTTMDTSNAEPSERSEPQNPAASDSQDSNATSSIGGTSVDAAIDEIGRLGAEEGGEKKTEPHEKKSAFRKATILSGTKPKLKKSLLNGTSDKKPTSSLLPENNPAVVNKALSGVERRKRKDNHKPAAVGEPSQKLLRKQELEGSFLTPLPGAENVQAPTSVIKWDSVGLGMLPGSTLKFTRNAEGMIEIQEAILNGKMEFIEENGVKTVKPRDPQEIYCCIECSCYGLLSEFYHENFCSSKCQDKFLFLVDKISSKLGEEPIVISAAEEKKAVRRKMVEADEKNEPTPIKQRKLDTPGAADDSSQESLKKSKLKTSEKAEERRPGIIKLKSIEFMNASQNASPARQLRAREAPIKKASLKFIVSQDIEGLILEDDDKMKNVNVDPFPWSEYLMATESKPAWIKLFRNISTGSNPFKIGFKLEAIDPERQGRFCAATVSDVQGHRLKIHFDGYSNKYDFWTNMDSPYIFECGFSERHGFKLQPPFGMKKGSFNWEAYQSHRKSRPCHLLWFRQNNCQTSSNMFRPGMKLEAVDKKNTQLTCVATCVGLLENRILVHFDSWSDVYDYWVDTCSPYIHPVGWCKSKNRELTPPNFYNPATFSWEAYLKETKSEAAPAAAFTLRPPHAWKKSTKLEAIDKRAPHLLRVATVKEVLPYQLKLAFDGFPDHFGYWVDDDCPDIHPVNYGLKTGHQVTGPPEPYRITNSSCPTPGCVGDGNFRGLHTDKHSTAEECPYSNDHLNSESPLQDRLSDRKGTSVREKKKPAVIGQDSDTDSDNDPEQDWQFLDAAIERADPKSRVASDGSRVAFAKQSSPPFVLPAFQVYASSKAMSAEKSGDTCNFSRKTGRRPTEERNMNLDSDSYERKSNQRGASNVGTGSRSKGDTGATSDRIYSRTGAKSDGKGREKIKNEFGSRAAILTWNNEELIDVIKELPPKCQNIVKKLKLNGDQFLLLELLLGNKLFDNVAPAAKLALSQNLTSLQQEALIGLDQWTPCKANARFGNSSQV